MGAAESNSSRVAMLGVGSAVRSAADMLRDHRVMWAHADRAAPGSHPALWLFAGAVHGAAALDKAIAAQRVGDAAAALEHANDCKSTLKEYADRAERAGQNMEAGQ